jgi:hypothetical protein
MPANQPVSPRVEGRPAQPRLLDQFRQALLTQRLPVETTEILVGWVCRFLFFPRGRRPEDAAMNAFCHPADMRETRSASTSPD